MIIPLMFNRKYKICLRREGIQEITDGYYSKVSSLILYWIFSALIKGRFTYIRRDVSLFLVYI